MDERDTQDDGNSGAIPSEPTADLAAWIEAHRVRSVSCRLEDLSGLPRARRAIAALAYGLLHADELRAAGGSVPRAVLLAGPVGCGKTTLARALAGLVAQHGVFLELAASELTPARVAALGRFTGEQDAPTVVFIDEVSWLGVDRSSRRHDPESRAALYALLSAVSGLRDPARAPVVWLGATSEELDSLDEALTRPGRFSHVITVSGPDRPTRLAYLERLLAARRAVAPLDLEPIVEMTVGWSYAALEEVVDRALASAMADGGRDAAIDATHLREAVTAAGRIAGGGGSDEAPERTPAEKWRTSAHECGHGLVGAVLLGVGAVRALHIAPRAGGTEGGHTILGEAALEGASRPLTDAELRARMAVLLAGGLAEALLAAASTGTDDDNRRVGQLAMERLDAGFEPAWPVSLPAWVEIGPAAADRRTTLVWRAVDAARAQAEAILEAHRAGLEQLARRLPTAGALAGTPLREALAEALAADNPVTS